MTPTFPIEKFKELRTPFYYYDTTLLRQTLETLKEESSKHENYNVHYAVKANANAKLLSIINEYGFGIDCVSGGEINAVLSAGFPADKIVYAGVGKSDWEISLGIDKGILCFNVESLAELEVINQISMSKDKKARVCLRINPEVGAHTHSSITTGRAEDKFGISMEDMEQAIKSCMSMSHIEFKGLHFHIGSQILDMNDYKDLCIRINELQDKLDSKGIHAEIINVGGGLGVDYVSPECHPIPDFHSYFATFAENLKLREGQSLHFELGRAIVAQCGSLITKVLYVKEGNIKKFVIVDAGMTELIRPALYQAHHKIINISNRGKSDTTYDVVGPICESDDVFDKDIMLPTTKRNDYIAILTAGAYGEAMSSQYNCRPLPPTYLSEEIGISD